MDKWLKTGTFKRSASRTEIRTTDLAAMEITVDQQDDNHEVQMPTDCPVQQFSSSSSSEDSNGRVEVRICLSILIKGNVCVCACVRAMSRRIYRTYSLEIWHTGSLKSAVYLNEKQCRLKRLLTVGVKRWS
ncbi:hypothetical protein AVEN_256878-1 [Araneus ventricosus]|uniref:Uncharacterized protein n=1 Tax=Araneus ventricosus TaxID=182803 RepID=A0A4Y2CHU0_ARAVE|nr:hypothetical protein AVEN_256878-1 [Araneus ventricosus]